MRKLMFLVSLFLVCQSYAENPENTKTCTKSEWSTPIIVYGKSKETCTTKNPDGSKTITQTNCTKRGVSASVKGVGYKTVTTHCETPVSKTIPEKSSTTNSQTSSANK